MVRLVLIIFIITLFVSCQYRIGTVNGEEVFVGNPHRLFKESDETFHQLIDTNAVYRKIKVEYAMYLKFDSNGWMIMKFNLADKGFNVLPNSTNRGRYHVEGNKIRTELFFSGDSFFRETLVHRSIWKGIINGDTLKLKYDNGTHIFVKSRRYYFENGELNIRGSDDD